MNSIKQAQALQHPRAGDQPHVFTARTRLSLVAISAPIDGSQTTPPPLQAFANPPVIRTRLARTSEDFARARALVREKYTESGYVGMGAGSAQTEYSDDRITLLAEHNGTLAGTLSLRLDGPNGLLAERVFPEEVREARASGMVLSELTALAVAKRSTRPHVCGALFTSAFQLWGAFQQLTDALIEVNPRHLGFYCRVLGFVVVGNERLCPRVNAPAILLRLQLAEFKRKFVDSLESPALPTE